MEKGLREALDEALSRELYTNTRSGLEDEAIKRILESEKSYLGSLDDHKLRTQPIMSLNQLPKDQKELLRSRGPSVCEIEIGDGFSIYSGEVSMPIDSRVSKLEPKMNAAHVEEMKDENYCDRTKLPTGYTAEEVNKFMMDEREK